MSYRSVKRVLGETHLELKCLLLFGVCALGLTLTSFWIYGSQTEKLVYKQNSKKGELLVDKILFNIHWQELETRTKPDAQQPDEDRKKWLDLIRDLSKDLDARHKKNEEEEDYRYSVLSPHSREAADAPLSEIDRDVLGRFSPSQRPDDPATGEVEYQERRAADDREFGYHYYQAVRASTKNCVFCHRGVQSRPNLLEGDLIAVIKVRISDKPVQADVQWNNAILWATAIITVFLLVVASYLIIRYVIAKPVKHLQDVSDAIAQGKLDKRAEINTGDEFEDLGVAFNRMVRHLVALQEEARQMNADLDAKVDELAQRNMQLYEMNRLKGDFLATVSHELRTPLNSIIGFSDILNSIEALNEKQKRYVSNIQSSGKMLLEMINDILDLAKIESGKMEIRVSSFRLQHVIDAQCDMARPLTQKKNIDLEVRVQAGMPELLQDQNKVQQILNNLLSNAIKFTPEGGRIVVRAHDAEDGFFELVVIDTGVGIAEGDRRKIFEKFRQGDPVAPGGDAMTREYSGTGLGLSIVKELCKLLGGEVTLESELGTGSTFTVRLPIHLPAPPEHEPYLPRPMLEGLGGSSLRSDMRLGDSPPGDARWAMPPASD